jgi:hypothetical protein
VERLIDDDPDNAQAGDELVVTLIDRPVPGSDG